MRKSSNLTNFKRFRRIWFGSGEKQYGFEEILPIYKAVSSESDTGTFADFMEAFKTYDREGQGFINAAELRHVLCSLGSKTRPPLPNTLLLVSKAHIPLGTSRHVSTRHDTTRSTCRAHAFWLSSLSNSTARHARHDELDWLKTPNVSWHVET